MEDGIFYNIFLGAILVMWWVIYTFMLPFFAFILLVLVLIDAIDPEDYIEFLFAGYSLWH